METPELHPKENEEKRRFDFFTFILRPPSFRAEALRGKKI